MPDPSIIAALVLLVALVEATPAVRLPIGLLLAIALLTSGADLLPIALCGAVGVMLARLGLALIARAGRDRLATASPEARARREAMHRQLAASPAYARTTFLLGAFPGMPAGFLFPMLGAMRAPLGPALLGTVVGRTPLLALTAALFTGLGRLVTDDDDQAAVTLGLFAIVLFVMRTISRIDWQHRSETGRWRLRDADENAVRMTTMFGGMQPPPGGARPGPGSDDDPDVIEGELLGEEVDDDPDDDDDPPAALPHTGAAPA